MTRSLRMIAVIASVLHLPDATNGSYFTVMSGLKRVATTAGKYRGRRIAARPPRMCSRPAKSQIDGTCVARQGIASQWPERGSQASHRRRLLAPDRPQFGHLCQHRAGSHRCNPKDAGQDFCALRQAFILCNHAPNGRINLHEVAFDLLRTLAELGFEQRDGGCLRPCFCGSPVFDQSLSSRSQVFKIMRILRSRRLSLKIKKRPHACQNRGIDFICLCQLTDAFGKTPCLLRIDPRKRHTMCSQLRLKWAVANARRLKNRQRGLGFEDPAEKAL